MRNADVARVFSQLATMLEMDGANPFRIRAYREAARVVESLAEPVEELADQEGRLESLQGIGKDLAGKIRDIVRTGTTELFEENKKKYPPEVVELTELQGLGPKRVRILFEKLGIRNRAGLEQAARSGKLRELAGFGEVMEKKILAALASATQWSGRTLLASAWPVAHSLLEHIRRIPGVTHAELAGSFRRRKETIGDLDVLVCGGDPEAVMTAFTSHGDVIEVLGRGGTKSSVKMRNGLQVDLRVVPAESFGAALLYFTGNKEHNIELRKIAIDRGMMLSEYSLSRDGKSVAGRTEEEVYRALGLPWIPPELREARGEIALARKGALPRLIEVEELRGDLHMHTDRTDGRDTLADMVRAARDRGYAYCAITDHSQSLAMTFGFDGARVRQSIDEIAAVRREVPGIEVLHGLEVDILADGALDLDDESLALLDWVIVSIHSRLDQPGPVITQRILKAIENPAVNAVGHLTGRLIGRREAGAMDIEKIAKRAAELGVAVEINAQPDRTDLSDVNARLAHDHGVTLVIDTDAHGTRELDFMRYGVFAARRARLEAKDVLNTLPYEQLVRRIRKGALVGASAGKGTGGNAGKGTGTPAMSPGKGAAKIGARRTKKQPATGKAPRRKR